MKGARPHLTVHPASPAGPARLAWTVPGGWRALSSASVGGGLVSPRWVLNVDVGGAFSRTDLEEYAAEAAAGLGLEGPGCALLTAADVEQVEHAQVDGVEAWATVGVTKPTWAVRPAARHEEGPGDGGLEDGRAVRSCHTGRPGNRCDTTERHKGSPTPGRSYEPGTINIVVSVPVPLTASALVQAVGTVTEAKAQALVQAGVPGTGTASDAVVVLAPTPDGAPTSAEGAPGTTPVRFAGVRSEWGERIARAVHDAVAAGLVAHPWPAPDVDPDVVW